MQDAQVSMVTIVCATDRLANRSVSLLSAGLVVVGVMVVTVAAMLLVRRHAPGGQRFRARRPCGRRARDSRNRIRSANRVRHVAVLTFT